jgi:hypothetical protein
LFISLLLSKLAVRGRVGQLRSGSQLQNLFRREPHSVRLQRVPLHLGYELRLVVGADLETALAVKYVFLDHLAGDPREGPQQEGKL